MNALTIELEECRRARRTAEENAERFRRSRAEFLSVLSHELRTPLNGVLGTIGLLAESPLGTEQRALISAVEDGAGALVAILDTIHDFTDLHEGRLEIARAPIDLGPWLGDIERTFKARAAAKHLSFRLNAGAGVPGRALGDGRRLRRMLDALIDNAVKFTERGGVSVEVEAVGAVLRFEVTDTGIGIPADRRAEVFADLARLDQSYARRFTGTGLGLAVTRRLAELMNGQVGVDAGPHGRGSRFWIEIPLDVPPASPRVVTVRPSPVQRPGEVALRRVVERHQPHILVAEDTRTNQLIVRTMLERADCRVDVVASGAEAVEAVRAHAYDLILMDIAMPGMDGIEATRRIRALPGHGRRVPIVAVTANLAGEERDTYLTAGMDDCLLKPFRADDLKVLIARLLNPPAPAIARAEGDEEAQPLDAPPLFDSAAIASLGGEIDPEALSGILVSFVEDMTSRLDRIATAADSANLRALAFESHAVSSCSRTFGAMRLARVCNEIEHAVEGGADIQALTLARAVGRIGTETLHALSEYRGAA